MQTDEALAIRVVRASGRVCFFAHYHPHGIVAPHVLIHLAALKAAGFAIVVLSTAELADTERARLGDACDWLVMRRNVGLDFGGWIEAYGLFMPLEAQFLLLANDSVYAPIGDLSGFIDRLTAVPADVYGAVESLEVAPHIQSWFLMLRPSAYRSNAFRQLMAEPIPADMPKKEIIDRFEVGFTKAMIDAGLRLHAAYSPARSGWIARNRPFNPMHLIWRQLVEDGLPFLKVEVLRDDPVRVRGRERWRSLVARLAPDLVAPIEEDVARRRTFTAEQRWRREHWYWSLVVDRAVYWPELHALLVRDHSHHGRVASQLHRAAFLLLEWSNAHLRHHALVWVERRARRREAAAAGHD